MHKVSMVQVMMSHSARSEIFSRMLELSGEPAGAVTIETDEAFSHECEAIGVDTAQGTKITLPALAIAEYLSGTGPWDEGGRFAGSNRYQIGTAADERIIDVMWSCFLEDQRED
ncbi:hypothetical protein HB779_15310 [Phyllobacterium sp. 628]|uniref:hypothetical protein n=1 Tax=Phyllobacterium sp. 628 TaxID=2718938 RepID=UPI0016622F2A|nr:hypothetical protein [Phyllobacterium sp. 628]QND53117.1 hypothetical protein HB779_15310 [Phyllobacterium sp. 628]